MRRHARPWTGTLFLLAALLLPAACSRSVAIGSPTVPTFAINLTNAAAIDLAVSWDDGSGPRALGLVGAGRTERFVIAGPRQTSITVTGASPDGSRRAEPVTVSLTPGSPIGVTLRVVTGR